MSRDLDLLRRFADSRDPDALGSLYRLHYASLYRVATACVPRHQDARDAVHGAFLAATRRCHGFRGEGSVRSWLVTILLNQSRDAHRRERPVTDIALLADLRSLAPPAPALLERGETEERMVAALRALPSEIRDPLTLHYFEDMTIAEIGRVLGVPRATVHDRCARGLRALRGSLGQEARTRSFAAAFAGLIPATGGKALTGGLLMVWKAVALVACVAFLGWWSWRGAGSGPVGEDGTERVVGITGEGTATDAAAGSPEDAPRPIRSRPYSESGAAAAPWEVRGMLSCRDGRGLVGVIVRGILYPGWYEAGFPIEAPEALATADLVSGPDGRFVWGLPVPASPVTLHFEVKEGGHLPAGLDRLVPTGAPAPDDIAIVLSPLDARVEGTVRGPDGDPVPGATVSSDGGTAVTDPEGKFCLAVPGRRGGRQRIYAWAEGLAVAEEWIDAPGPGESAEAHFTLAPCGAVDGRVLDDRDRPVSGALVTCWGFRPIEQTTGDDGRFRIDHIPQRPGFVAVFARAVGFAPIEETIGPHTLGTELLLRLSPGTRVQGVVTDTAGNPVPNALVALGLVWDDSRALRSVTDASGAFVFPHVRLKEQMFVIARAVGLAQARVPVDPAAPEMRVVLAPERTLAGRVTDGRGAPLEGIRLSLLRDMNPSGHRGRTDAEGRFAIGGLPAGRFLVEVSGTGWVTAHLHVEAGEEDLRIVLEPRGALAGRIVDGETGRPVPRFVLRLFEAARRPGDPPSSGIPGALYEGQRFTDPEGTFRIEGAFPLGSPFGIEVRAEGYARETLPRIVATADPAPLDATIRLRRGAVLEGRVIDAVARAGIPGASVHWSRSAGEAVEVPDAQPPSTVVVTDEEGRFRFPDPALGDLWLHAAGEGFASRVEGPVAVAPGEARVVTIALHPGWPSLRGRVVDAHGRPCPDLGITVDLAVRNGYGKFNLPNVRTDDDGRFVFERIPPGDARLSVTQRAGRLHFRMFGGTVSIPERGTADVILAPPGDAVLSVLVTGTGAEEGRPLVLHAFPEGSAPGRQGSLAALVQNGVAELDGLAQGRHTLQLQGLGPGWQATTTVWVTAGHGSCTLEASRR